MNTMLNEINKIMIESNLLDFEKSIRATIITSKKCGVQKNTIRKLLYKNIEKIVITKKELNGLNNGEKFILYTQFINIVTKTVDCIYGEENKNDK